MDSLLQLFFTAVLLYRYAAIFLVEAVGAVGVPIPSGAILVSSFVFSSQGYLNPFAVGLVSWAATVIGDVLGFLIARKYGKAIFSAIGLRRLIESSAFTTIERRVERAPNITVVFSRIVTTIAPVVNIVAGLSRMNLRSFLLADLIGQLLNVLLNAFYGYVLGDSWTSIVSVTEKVGILIALIIILIAVWILRRRRRGRQ